MPLSFPEYCAYWFVKSCIGAARDTDPPTDAAFDGEHLRLLARRILKAIARANLTASSQPVELEADAFLAESAGWLRIFDAVDSVIACARTESAATDPRVISMAFGDFLAARWIYRRVLHEELAAQPDADEAFPPPYDADAKRGLATALASQCVRIETPVRNRQAFVASAARWRSLGEARSALLKHVLAVVAMVVLGSPAYAQLVDAGGTADEIVTVFLQKAHDGEWHGGAATRGEQSFAGDAIRLNWQIDYGSAGSSRVTPSGNSEGREPEVSRNSGSMTVGYVQPLTERWRIKADIGVEHHSILGTVRPLLNASLRTIGARMLWRGNVAPQVSWLAQSNVSTAAALTETGHARRFFVEPVVVGWIAFVPGYASEPDGPKLLFRRIQLRAEAAGISPIAGGVHARGHWDGSVVFFFTPGNGIMLRRFSGYFDHNLRDRKSATTINLLWKYR